jgi:hypothetical protein
LIQPDWSAMLARLDESPPSVAPRWICPCLTYHWLLNWYRPTGEAPPVLVVAVGERVEVVLGATAHHNGRETIFREDHAQGVIIENELPGFLADRPVWQIIDGVSVRRWEAQRIPPESVESLAPQVAVLLLLPPTCEPSPNAWTELVQASQEAGRQMLTFKPVPMHRGMVRSLLAPAAEARDLRREVGTWGPRCAEDARWFVDAQGRDGG